MCLTQKSVLNVPEHICFDHLPLERRPLLERCDWRFAFLVRRQPKAAGVLLMGTSGILFPNTVDYMETACDIEEDKVIHPFAFRTHTHALGEQRRETLKLATFTDSSGYNCQNRNVKGGENYKYDREIM